MGGSSVQVHSTRIQKAPDDKVCDTNDIQTGECNANPSQNIQGKCSKLSATPSPNTDVQSNMSESTPEGVEDVPLQTLGGYTGETMNVDGRPKVMGGDPGKGNLDNTPNTVDGGPLQTYVEGRPNPNKVDGGPLQTYVDGRPKVRGGDPGKGNLDSNPDAMNFETLQSLGGNPRQRMQLDDNPNAVDGGPLQTLGCLGKTKRVLEGGSIEKQSIKFSKTEGQNSKVIPKTWRKGQRFQGVDKNTGNFVSGSIVSRAGKATGSNRNCYNVILDSSGMHGWFNMDTLKDIEVSGEDENVIYMLMKRYKEPKRKR
ncbi:unnamed protein product [Meganyctiphanes norvegica]|uniref:Uncharacterized protein n=1 Tax=Meganyctiphanes norvegica TaxID=48144 RepID=A0AAV2RJL9_MEGNR